MDETITKTKDSYHYTKNMILNEKKNENIWYNQQKQNQMSKVTAIAFLETSRMQSKQPNTHTDSKLSMLGSYIIQCT